MTKKRSAPDPATEGAELEKKRKGTAGKKKTAATQSEGGTEPFSPVLS